MKRMLARLLVAGSMLFLCNVSLAGDRGVVEVFVDPAGHAYGSLGSALNSADSIQFIGCIISAVPGAANPSLSCQARDKDGVMVTCFSHDPVVVQAASTLSGDSLLEFYFDSHKVCTEVNVANYSFYEPKR